jgi:hypothetical protein
LKNILSDNIQKERKTFFRTRSCEEEKSFDNDSKTKLNQKGERKHTTGHREGKNITLTAQFVFSFLWRLPTENTAKKEKMKIR